MKKADQLARLCHADVALIIRRNGRYYTYRSTDHERWPPSMTEIVCIDVREPHGGLERIVVCPWKPSIRDFLGRELKRNSI